MNALARDVFEDARTWQDVCGVDDIPPDSGVCARVGGEQVAIFRVPRPDAGHDILAIDNYDPNSGANVLSRGIVGDLKGRLVVASPLHKQHFDLKTGECLEDPVASVRTHAIRIVDGRVQVECRLAHLARRSLVVVGNGMAAMHAVEELLRIAPGVYRITVFGAEPRGNYNRVLLSPVLSGEKQAEDIFLNTPEWYARRGVVLHAGDPVIGIDRIRRRVRSASGYEIGYDRLLLATGSRPMPLRVPGETLPGVITFRDLDDVECMLAAVRSHTRAVVIGGGLLGLEAAHGLQRRGMHVTLVHRATHLMNRQLDPAAAALLRQSLEARGIGFELGASTAAILGETRVTGVRLADGRELPADVVVTAIGIQPEITLARAAGLHCERGVVVDDTLQTYDPHIYAVGECVQHRDTTYGLVAPLHEQAGVCATHLANLGIGRYAGSVCATQLKVSGIALYSAGEIECVAGSDELVLRDAGRGVYKRLLLRAGCIAGIVLYGDAQDGAWYFELMRARVDVSAHRDRLLLGPRHCAGLVAPTTRAP